MASLRSVTGFTLVEVLIALAISALVAVLAYSSLSRVIDGVQSSQAAAERVYAINRAWSILSRDLEQFARRPVRDEFGEWEPALYGGVAAPVALSFSRSGWHNPLDQPRPELQRVSYRLEDGTLWRDSYPVLDRTSTTPVQQVSLLTGVEALRVLFLDGAGSVNTVGRNTELDTRGWSENWLVDSSSPGQLPDPPLAVELSLELTDWGEMRRIYALPPL